MEIKVLGGGCANCKKLLQNATQAVKEMAVEANILYITDMAAIAASGLMRTPGLIINGKVASYGRVPTVDEIKVFITNTK